MNREDIIRMAREAGFEYSGAELSWESVICTEELERFAALVASAEREKHKWDIHSCSPTCNRYACVATREAVLAEREACAKVCDVLAYHPEFASDATKLAAMAIRARGQS